MLYCNMKLQHIGPIPLYLKYCFIGLFFFTFTALSQDTIPFKLGHDNRIYIKVSVNESEPLDFIFDTGANAMVANTTIISSKLDLRFNSTTQNTGANGTINQKLSVGNTLTIGKFQRKNESLLGIPYPEEYYTFDGVIGYNFFEDYFIEINYELEKLILHSTKRTISGLKSYYKEKMKVISNVPFIDLTLFKGEKKVTFPAMIDTGFNDELIVYHNIVSQYKLANYFEKIGNSKSEGTDGLVINSDQVIIPKGKLGKDTIEGLIANLNLTPTTTPFPAIMGGAILKKRNWILNFEKKLVYSKAIQ